MRLRATLAAAALITLAAAAPAAADPFGDPMEDRGLFLTVSGSDNTWIRGVRLLCPAAPGAHHPHAAAACAAIDEAGGDMDRLPGDPHLCTMELDPVTATATGTWNGRAVNWQHTFGNACELEAATGVVARF
ncbi:SSI family serine proteinase inhibitor [Streptomyces sp. NBC_01217]|uniref:SSI family serine proteinase inhibitor n=1 Tax=Streptomyces sp. NBC_01217 TaxID=2903779 RepID=UPI002E1508CE|nr:subtilase-type protease inhibitor [Streptomyces sp. NBC_01217]